MALALFLVGCAWLLYFYLPVNAFAYFWGFFAMAAILVVLGAVLGLVAARVMRRAAPPVPSMAIDEARKIRDTVSADEDASGLGTGGVPVPPPAPAGVASARGDGGETPR
jgi:hypothetical protein